MKIIAVTVLLALSYASSCNLPPPESVAYKTAVAAKAFIDAEKKQHSECTPANNSTVCVDLAKATGAKDTLIDVAEALCAGPNFNNGGQCDFPAKTAPGYQQAVDKLNAAIANYNQTVKDLKSATGGN